MTLQSVISVLWPAFLVLGLIPVLLMCVESSAIESDPNPLTVTFVGLGVLLILYSVQPVREVISWMLTVLGFAMPVALSVISIQYIVEETDNLI